MLELFNRHARFVRKRFPDHTIKGVQNKLRSEVTELGRSKTNFERKLELVDVILVAFAYADSLGMTFEDLEKGLEHKIGVNEKRKWKLLKDGSYQHIKWTGTL